MITERQTKTFLVSFFKPFLGILYDYFVYVLDWVVNSFSEATGGLSDYHLWQYKVVWGDRTGQGYHYSLYIESFVYTCECVCHEGKCLPAGSPGSWRLGTGRIWRWWCGSGCFHMATSVTNRWNPSSHQRAAEPESSLQLRAPHWPQPGIWWKTNQGLT